jgi:hypothetical protein
MAKGKDKIAKAELEASYKPSPEERRPDVAKGQGRLPNTTSPRSAAEDQKGRRDAHAAKKDAKACAHAKAKGGRQGE